MERFGAPVIGVQPLEGGHASPQALCLLAGLRSDFGNVAAQEDAFADHLANDPSSLRSVPVLKRGCPVKLSESQARDREATE